MPISRSPSHTCTHIHHSFNLSILDNPCSNCSTRGDSSFAILAPSFWYHLIQAVRFAWVISSKTSLYGEISLISFTPGSSLASLLCGQSLIVLIFIFQNVYSFWVYVYVKHILQRPKTEQIHVTCVKIHTDTRDQHNKIIFLLDEL